MRIIAGVAKGRTLGSVAESTRPTSDRAREALFSSLTSEFGDFLGLHILDLFAGSGAIGLEALSRGASIVHAIESGFEAQKTIHNNYEIVRKSQPTGDFHLYSMSVQRFINESAKEKYHFVYIDPPFDFSDSEVEDVVSKLHTEGFLKRDAMVAVERTTKGSKFSWPDGFTPLRQRKYGAATIYFANYAP